jgi:hypothetical protein
VTPIESTPEGGFIATGDGVYLYRLTAMIMVVKVKAESGLSLSRNMPKVKDIKASYNKYLSPDDQIPSSIRSYAGLLPELRRLQQEYVNTGDRRYLGLPPKPANPQENPST